MSIHLFKENRKKCHGHTQIIIKNPINFVLKKQDFSHDPSIVEFMWSLILEHHTKHAQYTHREMGGVYATDTYLIECRNTVSKTYIML